MVRLTAWAAVELPRIRATPLRRWAVDIVVTLMVLDLLYWIRR